MAKKKRNIPPNEREIPFLPIHEHQQEEKAEEW